jgi:hypothetical protein
LVGGQHGCTNAAVALASSQHSRTDAAFALGEYCCTDAAVSLVISGTILR